MMVSCFSIIGLNIVWYGLINVSRQTVFALLASQSFFAFNDTSDGKCDLGSCQRGNNGGKRVAEVKDAKEVKKMLIRGERGEKEIYGVKGLKENKNSFFFLSTLLESNRISPKRRRERTY